MDDKQITIRMPKADLELVLATLRAPENQDKQGNGSMWNHTGYCCLGAMQCAKTGGKIQCVDGNIYCSKWAPALRWLKDVGWEFKSVEGNLGYDPYLPLLNCTAIEANDVHKYSFAEIADAIEDCAEGY